MQYVRQRRLTEAARTLANGAPDILNIALHAGYNSHEAFTRAFHDHFGITPEALRAQGNLSNIKLTEPIRMDQTVLTKLDAPRIENGKAMLIAGMGRRYNNETCAAIPAQWQEFSQHLGRIRAQVGTAAFGVLCNGDDAGYIDYICGVQVSGFSKIPDNWTRLEIPEQRYAVFLHRDHISTIRRTWFTIFNTWLQKSEYKAADGPEFELYRETFNPPTGLGDVEIWVPIH